jgi:flagellar basal-body rod protein FlgB
MSNIPMLQQLTGYLQLTNQRQQLIVSNMANVDTPGSHTQDLDFQGAMQQVVNEGGATMTPASQEVVGLPERPDGNNVNVDREGLLLSQTQLQYQMGVQLIKAEFHKLLTAIKEGS